MEAAAGLNDLSGIFNLGYGIVIYLFSFYGFDVNPADFDQPDHLTVAQNIFGNLPYFGKVFAAGEAGSAARLAVGAVDVIGDLTGSGLAVAKLFAS